MAQLHRDDLQRHHLHDHRLHLIEGKLDLLLMKADTILATTKSTGPRVDWTKIIESLWLRAMVLILLLMGNAKMLDIAAVLLLKK